MKKYESQIQERITKTARLANMFSRENEYTWKLEEKEQYLERLKEEQETATPEQELWYYKAIVKTETEIRYLKQLEAERRKYDELRSQITALMNCYL